MIAALREINLSFIHTVLHTYAMGGTAIAANMHRAMLDCGLDDTFNARIVIYNTPVIHCMMPPPSLLCDAGACLNRVYPCLWLQLVPCARSYIIMLATCMRAFTSLTPPAQTEPNKTEGEAG